MEVASCAERTLARITRMIHKYIDTHIHQPYKTHEQNITFIIWLNYQLWQLVHANNNILSPRMTTMNRTGQHSLLDWLILHQPKHRCMLNSWVKAQQPWQHPSHWAHPHQPNDPEGLYLTPHHGLLMITPITATSYS